MTARQRSTGVAIGILFAIGLTGCESSARTDDLRQFVANAHAGLEPRVEPLPEVKPHEVFTYAAADRVDPFSPTNLKPKITAGPATGGPRPDLNRRREPLEEYPLDALRMVGTLERADQAWVVVRAPDGTVHRAGVGDHIGQNFGTIRRISEDKVEIVELIQGAIGNWIEREATLALAEQQKR